MVPVSGRQNSSALNAGAQVKSIVVAEAMQQTYRRLFSDFEETDSHRNSGWHQSAGLIRQEVGAIDQAAGTIDQVVRTIVQAA